jgi:hypothetical protein
LLRRLRRRGGCSVGIGARIVVLLLLWRGVMVCTGRARMRIRLLGRIERSGGRWCRGRRGGVGVCIGRCGVLALAGAVMRGVSGVVGRGGGTTAGGMSCVRRVPATRSRSLGRLRLSTGLDVDGRVLCAGHIGLVVETDIRFRLPDRVRVHNSRKKRRLAGHAADVAEKGARGASASRPGQRGSQTARRAVRLGQAVALQSGHEAAHESPSPFSSLDALSGCAGSLFAHSTNIFYYGYTYICRLTV